MSMFNLIELAFKEGCGLSIEEVLADSEYHALVEEEVTCFDRHPNGELFKHMTQVEYWRSVYRLLHFDERQICLTDEPCYHERYMEQRALLRFLGRKLIKAASQHCLPVEAVELAKEWRETDSQDERYLIADRLFQFLFAQCQKTAEPLDETTEEWSRRLLDQTFASSDYRTVLPLQMGLLGAGPTRPVCLGVGLVLAGWAELAGARSLVACSLHRYDELFWEYKGRSARLIMEDLRRRGLEKDAPYLGLLREDCRMSEFQAHCTDGFHIALAVHPGGDDGTWIYIDPFGGMRGFIYSETWPLMEAAALNVEASQSTMPGCTVVVDDGGAVKEQFAKVMEGLEATAHLSRHLQQLLRIAGWRSPDIIEWLDGQTAVELFRDLLHPDFDWNLSPKARKKHPNWTPLVEASIEHPSVALIYQILDWRLSRWYGLDRMQRALARLIADERRFKRRVRAVLARMYAHGLNKWNSRMGKFKAEGRQLHQSFELGSPDMLLALHVLNNLCCWAPGERVDQRELMAYCASQIFWFAATRLDTERDNNLPATDMEWLIGLLDPVHRHPLVTKKLEILGRSQERG